VSFADLYAGHLDWILRAREGFTVGDLLDLSLDEIEDVWRVIVDHEREIRKARPSTP